MLYYELKAQINRGEIAPAYQISGEDKYWCELAYKDITALSSEIDLEVIGDTQSIEDAIWALQNIPMMSDYKVVVVRDRKLKDDEQKRVAKYLADPAPKSVLVFYNCECDIEGAKKFKFSVLSQAELVPYVTRAVTNMGGEIEDSAVRKLCEYCEANMTRINNELIKLVPIGKITDKLVAEYVEPSVSYKVFDFTDAITRGSYTGAYNVLASLAKSTYEYSPFFSRLTDHVRLMLHARLAKNVSDAELSQRLGVSLYPVQKARKSANAYTPKQLLSVLMKLYSLEADYKSGLTTVENAMDLAIAEAIEARKR